MLRAININITLFPIVTNKRKVAHASLRLCITLYVIMSVVWIFENERIRFSWNIAWWMYGFANIYIKRYR
jgi:hypothetical protein